MKPLRNAPFGLAHGKTDLRAPPKDVLRSLSPFLLNQVADFALIELTTKMLPELIELLRVTKHCIDQPAIPPGKRAEQVAGQLRTLPLQLGGKRIEFESAEITTR